MKSYVVVGLGLFGSAVAQRLAELGCEVLAMDIKEELVQEISNSVTHAVVADAQDQEVLRALGVREFDCAIIAIGDDLAASVLATMNMQELGVPYIVCKAHDDKHRRVLEKMGANRVVIPETENALRLARSLSAPNLLDYIELGSDCGIVEVPVPAQWRGKSLKELNVRAKYGINIIAIEREGKINASLTADYRFSPEDIIVVLGDEKTIDKVQKL